MLILEKGDHVRNLLTKTVATICKEMIDFEGKLTIEGLLSIIVDEKKVLNVFMNENVVSNEHTKLTDRSRKSISRENVEETQPEEHTTPFLKSFNNPSNKSNICRDDSVNQFQRRPTLSQTCTSPVISTHPIKTVSCEIDEAPIDLTPNQTRDFLHYPIDNKFECGHTEDNRFAERRSVLIRTATPDLHISDPTISAPKLQVTNFENSICSNKQHDDFPTITRHVPDMNAREHTKNVSEQKLQKLTSDQTRDKVTKEADLTGIRLTKRPGCCGGPPPGIKTEIDNTPVTLDDDEDSDMDITLSDRELDWVCGARSIKQEAIDSNCKSSRDLWYERNMLSASSYMAAVGVPANFNWNPLTSISCPTTCSMACASTSAMGRPTESRDILSMTGCSSGCLSTCSCCSRLAWARHRDAIRARKCRARRGYTCRPEEDDEDGAKYIPPAREIPKKPCDGSCPCCRILKARKSNAKTRRQVYYQRQRDRQRQTPPGSRPMCQWQNEPATQQDFTPNLTFPKSTDANTTAPTN